MQTALYPRVFTLDLGAAVEAFLRRSCTQASHLQPSASPGCGVGSSRDRGGREERGSNMGPLEGRSVQAGGQRFDGMVVR